MVKEKKYNYFNSEIYKIQFLKILLKFLLSLKKQR